MNTKKNICVVLLLVMIFTGPGIVFAEDGITGELYGETEMIVNITEDSQSGWPLVTNPVVHVSYKLIETKRTSTTTGNEIKENYIEILSAVPVIGSGTMPTAGQGKDNPRLFVYGVTKAQISIGSNTMYIIFKYGENVGPQIFKLYEEKSLGDISRLITFPEKGTSIYWSIQQPTSGSGSGGGSTNTEEIEKSLDKVIEGITPSENDLTEIKDQGTEWNETTSQAIEKETQAQQQAEEALKEIKPEEAINEVIQGQKLTQSLRWIRDIHKKTVENSPLSQYIGVIMILGLSAYMIGRRGG